MSAAQGATEKGPLRKLVDALASFGFACILLLFLFFLTLIGTLEQVEHGLFEVQKRYFESWFLVYHLGGVVPIPLPGAQLVLWALALNLLLGGLVRIRKSRRTLGIIVVHVGIVVMLIAALVKLRWSDEGHLTLYESERSDEYVSYYLWEVAVFDASETEDVRELIIPGEDFRDLEIPVRSTPGTGGASPASDPLAGVEVKEARFTHDDLPFEIALSHFVRNCEPLPKGPMWKAVSPVVDGYALRGLPLAENAERNQAGLHVSVRDLETGETSEGLLWSLERAPWTVEAGGTEWAFSLRHKRYEMPFTVVLDDFTRELHPRTGIPAAFMSDVTKVEDASRQEIRIEMNEPLRHEGLVLFQSGWGPQNAPPGTPLFSVFSVVRNPSDYWPLYSCIIIGVGLILAFGDKLLRYVRAQSKERARREAATATEKAA